MRISITTLIVFAALLFPKHHASAQTEGDQVVVKPKVIYMNMFNSGALVGNKSEGTAFSFSTIHGVRRGKLAGGIGIGYDAYDRWKVVPVTASVAYDVIRIKNNALFVQVNGGAAVDAWRESEDYIGGPSYNFNTGRTVSSLLGYRITSGKFSMYFAAGYKYQRLNYDINNNYWWSLVDMMPGSSSYVPPSVYSVKQTMERFVIQIGIGLH